MRTFATSRMFFAAVLFCLLLFSDCSFGSEPVCSKFHYEEKTLEKMIRQEIFVEKMKAELDDTKQQVMEALMDLKNEREQFASDLQRKTNDIEVLKENLDKATDLVKTQNERNIELYTAEIEKVKDSLVTPAVAFKAHVVSDKTLNNNKVIIFSQNLLNAGDAYNNKTGVFVAPVGGIYHFSVQLCLSSKIDPYFGFILNGKIISGAELGEREWQKCYTMDATTAVDKGDEVSVQCTRACYSSYRLWDSLPYATNSFSGFLINN